MREPFTQLYVHLVWVTWDRLPLIEADLRRAIYGCIQDECRSLKVEPLRFYRGLVMHPLRQSPSVRGAAMSLLNVWSQVVYAAGYFYERTKRGWTVDSTEAPAAPPQPPKVVSRRDVT